MRRHKLTANQVEVLEKLLGRCERSSGGRVISVTVTVERFPSYFKEWEPEHIRQWEEEITALVSLGWIFVDRGLGAEAHLIRRIRLNADAVSAVNEAMGRIDLAQFKRHMTDIASRCACHAGIPDGLRDFFEREISERIPLSNETASRRKSSVAEYEILCHALVELSLLRSEMTWRQFSVRHFADSKMLDSLKPRIARILGEALLGIEPSDASGSRDVQGVLSHFYIEAKEELLLLKGAVILRRGDAMIEASQWEPFLSVPALMACDDAWKPDFSALRTVLTIENEETFHLWAKKSALPATLGIYLGGFPSHRKIAFLRRAKAAGLSFQHWGDLDCGGLEIFLFLEKTLETAIEPFQMSPSVLMSHPESTRSLSRAEVSRLNAIRSRMGESHRLVPLLERMLETRQKLEQEAV